MGRSYSNDSFSGRHVIQGLVAGKAINGTRASAAALETLIVSAPTQYTVKSFKIYHGVAGTCADGASAILNTHLAGTGAAAAIGTAVVGTATEVLVAHSSVDGSVSGTIKKGDRVTVTITAGTETAENPRVVPVVEIVEDFTNA